MDHVPVALRLHASSCHLSNFRRPNSAVYHSGSPQKRVPRPSASAAVASDPLLVPMPRAPSIYKYHLLWAECI